jgi:hypothetical protein
MFLSTHHQHWKPLQRTRDQIQSAVRDRPQLTVGGVVAVVALVGFAVWIWPELHRTIRIHRM